MQKEKHHELQTLFKALTGKSVIAAPITKEPTAGYQTARVERYYR